MGTRYVATVASGFNSSPPSDDSATTEANKVKWSTIKTKLADPVKNQVATMDSQLVTALDVSARATNAGDTAVATDHWRTIQVTTSTVTVSLSDAATMGAGYIVDVANQSNADILVALANAGNTIDGGTNVTQTISAKETRRYITNAAATGYITAGYGAGKPALGRGYLGGGTLSNNGSDATNDIDIAAGEARDSTNKANIVWSALTKQLDAAFAAGTNQGMRDTGAIANGTWHIYAIRRDSDGAGDILASTSATSPTMPSGYTYFRRIGAIVRESAALVAFTQVGDEVLRATPGSIATQTNPGTSAVLYTLNVPTGIKVRAIINANVSFAASGDMMLITSPDETDVAPSTTSNSLATNGFGTNTTHPARIEVRTNTSGQIRARVNGSDASVVTRFATIGWIDRRGRDD